MVKVKVSSADGVMVSFSRILEHTDNMLWYQCALAPTFQHNYLYSPFLQTNITCQMWPTGGKGVKTP